jgi:uncharacterized protein YjlB
MTTSVIISVPEHERLPVHVYRTAEGANGESKSTESFKINPGETRTITVWRESWIEVYEGGVSGEAG